MKTVIEMAREAGFQTGTRDYANGVGSYPIAFPIGYNTCLPELEAFAKLAREDEREACAKLVEPDEEHRRDASYYIGGAEGVELLDVKAAEIRERSNT